MLGSLNYAQSARTLGTDFQDSRFKFRPTIIQNVRRPPTIHFLIEKSISTEDIQRGSFSNTTQNNSKINFNLDGSVAKFRKWGLICNQ